MFRWLSLLAIAGATILQTMLSVLILGEGTGGVTAAQLVTVIVALAGVVSAMGGTIYALMLRQVQREKERTAAEAARADKWEAKFLKSVDDQLEASKDA